MLGTLALLPRPDRAAAFGQERSAIALDAISVDLLTSLEVMPLAAGGAQNYRPEFSDVSLADDVRDIGFASEPNLELLSSLKPDLFVSAWAIEDGNLLKRIAPLLSLKLYTGQSDAYKALQDALRATARAINRESTADIVIGNTDLVIQRCMQRLAILQRPPRLYVVDLSFGSGRIGIYGSHSLPHAVMTRLGLENAWREPDALWGWTSVELARLADDPAATIVWLQKYEPADMSAEQLLGRTELWKALPAVKAGRVIGLPPTDFFGGLQTATRFATLLADALLNHVT